MDKIKKIKIASDIDDCVVNLFLDFRNFCKENYGMNILPNKDYIQFWNLFESKERAIEIMNKYQSSNRAYNLEFHFGFKDVFKLLKEKYNFDFFITARTFDDRKKTLKFFKKNISNFNLKIYYSQDSFDKKKSTICKDLGISKIIEDSPVTSFDCAENNLEVLLLDRPWNQGIQHEKIIRVKDWREIWEVLKNE
jgi:uncharacterized HAD superfamily protein